MCLELRKADIQMKAWSTTCPELWDSPPQITGSAGNVKDCGQFCLYNVATSVGSVPSGNRKLPYPLSRTNGHEFFSLEWYFRAPEKYIHFLYGPWGHLEAWAMIFDREKTWDQYLNLAWHMREKIEDFCFSYLKAKKGISALGFFSFFFFFF